MSGDVLRERARALEIRLRRLTRKIEEAASCYLSAVGDLSMPVGSEEEPEVVAELNRHRETVLELRRQRLLIACELVEKELR